MKISLCLLVFVLGATVVRGQVIQFYSDKMKANVAIDVSGMQSSNSRAYAMLLEEGEEVTSHEIQGIKTKDDSLRQVAQDLTKKPGAASGSYALQQVQYSLSNDSSRVVYLGNQLVIITQSKQKALDFMDKERKHYKDVTQLARAQAAAARSSQYQPTSHHDFYSPAYEQLKTINRTGAWPN